MCPKSDILFLNVVFLIHLVLSISRLEEYYQYDEIIYNTSLAAIDFFNINIVYRRININKINWHQLRFVFTLRTYVVLT